MFICFPFFMVLFSFCTHKKIKIKNKMEKKFNQKKRANNQIHEEETLNDSVRGRYYYYSTWMTKAVIIHISVVVRRLSHFSFDFYFILCFVHFLSLSPLACCLWLSAFKQHLSWFHAHILSRCNEFFSEKVSVTTTTTGQTSKQSRMMRICFLLSRIQLWKKNFSLPQINTHSWNLVCFSFDFVLIKTVWFFFFFFIRCLYQNSLFTTHNSCSMRKQQFESNIFGFSFFSSVFFSLCEQSRQPFMQIIVLACLYVIANNYNWYSFTSMYLHVYWLKLRFFFLHPVWICGFSWPELPAIVFPNGICKDCLSDFEPVVRLEWT